MHRVYFSTSKVGESGGPKHAPHEIFSEIDLAKFSPCLAYPTTLSLKHTHRVTQALLWYAPGLV